MTTLDHLIEHDKARFAARSLEVWNAHCASMKAWKATDKGDSAALELHRAAYHLHDRMSFKANKIHRKYATEHISWVVEYTNQHPEPIVRPLAPDWRRANRDRSYARNSDD